MHASLATSASRHQRCDLVSIGKTRLVVILGVNHTTLTLDIPVEPYSLDLPRCVRVEIRPVTTAVMAAAQAGSARRLGALRAAEVDLDPDMARGLAFAFQVRALAMHAVAAWERCGRHGRQATTAFLGGGGSIIGDPSWLLHEWRCPSHSTGNGSISPGSVTPSACRSGVPLACRLTTRTKMSSEPWRGTPAACRAAPPW